MATAKRFEELQMWQRARALANSIYTMTENKSFRDRSLRAEMRRTAVAVMSHIADAFDRDSYEELMECLSAAKGSGARLQAQLHLAADQQFLGATEAKEARKLSKQTTQMINAFVKFIKAAGYTGVRYRRTHVGWAEYVQELMEKFSEEEEES